LQSFDVAHRRLAEVPLVLRAAVRGAVVRQTRSTALLGAPSHLAGDSPELLHERGVVVAPPRQSQLDP
jgi:hypothetical protein